MAFESPLAKAKGLGSAKQGTHYWWRQRLTAIALVPLSLWFVTSMVSMVAVDHSSVMIWLSSPLSAISMILFIIALFYHTQLGLQVIIEDYIHSEWQKVADIILVKLLAFIAGLASVLAVFKIFMVQ